MVVSHSVAQTADSSQNKPDTETMSRRDQSVNHSLINLEFLPKESIRAGRGVLSPSSLGEWISYVLAQACNLNPLAQGTT